MTRVPSEPDWHEPRCSLDRAPLSAVAAGCCVLLGGLIVLGGAVALAAKAVW